MRPSAGFPHAPQATTWLIGAKLVAFLFFAFVRTQGLLEHLIPTPRTTIGELHLWQLVTGIFVERLDLGGVISLVLSLLILYWIGSQLEPRWGRRGFLILFFASGVLGTLVGCLVGLVLSPSEVLDGSGFAITALIVAWGLVNRGRDVLVFGRLPGKAHVVAAILVALPVVATLIDGRFAQLAGYLVAIAAAFVLTRGFLDPQVLVGRARSAWARRKYRVIDGGRKGPTYLN